MKFSCNRETFLAAYQTAAAFAPTKSARAILANVKLDLLPDGRTGVLSATDTELGIRVTIEDLQIAAAGSCVLPTSRFGLVLRESSDDTLQIEADGTYLVVRGERSLIKLPAHNPDEFPAVPSGQSGYQIALEAATLRSVIHRTVFATDVESSRFALGGVLIDLQDGDGMVAVGTDGRRLAKVACPVRLDADGTVPQGTIIPARSLHLIERALGDESGEVVLAITSSSVVVQTATRTIYSRLVEGRFPAWRGVVPNLENAQSVSLLVGPFYAALRQAAIVTDKESKGIQFAFAPGSLVMSGQTADVGNSRVELPIAFDSDETKLTLDHRFLADFLRVLEPTDSFTLYFTGPDMPAVLSTADGYDYVVMPLSKD